MKFSTILNNFQGNSDKKSTPSSSQSTSSIPPIQSTSTHHLNPNFNFEYKTTRSSSIHTEVEDICCAICNESLSLRLAGEKSHVVPVCGHKLHASCFTAVYGGLARAKQGNSLGVCGICRKDMRLGEEGAENGRKNKFAAMAGLSQPQDSNQSRSTSQRPTSDIDKFSDSIEDDDLVQLPSLANLRLHNLNTLNGKASAETMRGSSSSSPRAGSPYQTGINSSIEVVKPIITVRSEHPKVVRSSNREEKQHLTCIISIELPSRYYPSDKERKEREWNLQRSNEQVDNELAYRSQGSISIKHSISSKNSDSTYAGQPSSPTSSSFSSPSYRIGSSGTSAATSPLSLSDDALAPIVDDLHRRMEDWKGHSPDEFGQLKLCDYIFVRKESNVREFLVYLFDEAILCVTDDKRKGDGKGKNNIRLKGRVYVKHIRNVADTSKDGELSITVYMSDENLDEFVMTFQDKSRMEVWKSQIETLVTLHHLSPSQRLASARSIITSTSMTGSLSADSNKSFNSDYSGGSDEFGKSPSSSVSSYVRHGKPKSFVIPEENSYDMRHFNLSDPPDSSKYTSSIASYPKTLSSTSSFVEKSPVSISSHLHPSSASSIHPLPSIHTSPNPRDFTPLDLMLVLALPSSSGSSTLKLRILKSSIYFILETVGPRTRISLITYQAGDGNRGKLGRSPFIAVGTQEGKQKLEKLVSELGSETIGEGGLYEHGEERVNVAAAVNVGLDIVLMRKTKSALTGMILMNDSTKDGTQKAQMDLVCARIESAQLPVHTIGWGNHDPSSLWLLSNHTSGTYSFVKEFYDLRDTLAGTVGSILSIGITHLKLHISVPEKRWFRIRKVSGTQNTILSSEGIDVDINIGELRFGEKRDLLIEVEMSLGTFGESQKRDDIRGKQIDTATDATAAFFLSNTGVNPSALDDYQPSNFYEDQYDEMADTAPLYEINASYRDPAAGQTVSRLSASPILLTIVVEPPVTLGRTILPTPPVTISAPEIVQRRMELLCSDMLTRTLLLMSRRNDTQAKKLLGETLRIISTINNSLSANQSSSTLSPAHLIARQTLLACSEDVQSVLVGCSDRSLFDSSTRSFCAELVVILRDQKSWTARTPVERLYFSSDLAIWALERSKAFISP